MRTLIIYFFITSFLISFSSCKKYGKLDGNIYWKYNEYVGNKPDAGSKIILYSADPKAKSNAIETTTDVQGNYKIEKILQGKYYLFIYSGNITYCPERHMENLITNAAILKNYFDFDLFHLYGKQIKEIEKLDSLYSYILTDDQSKYGGLEKQIKKYTSVYDELRNKSEKLINLFPESFKKQLKLNSAYGTAFIFYEIKITPDSTTTENWDFGVTCL